MADLGQARLVLADCLEALRTMPDASVDSVVTDPPYGLSFMGKRWDYDVPGTELWAECLRVLKPGGHLLAFAGTRTQHRMAVRIEDAGFEIRDMIAWVYGSGFPKSLDVAKAIDKNLGVEGSLGGPKTAAHAGWIERGAMRKAGGSEGNEGWQSPWMDDPVAVDRNAREYLPGSALAQQFKGWGTALKPALEPITVARKPLVGTVAENVLAHGTGALNIEAGRVGGEALSYRTTSYRDASTGEFAGQAQVNYTTGEKTVNGRWPANLIHDGSDEVAEVFGDPARFFYCAKASKSDRGAENNHPTVKPTDLMRYLCRLVTPPGGLVLDPFMGSGSTGKAAVMEGFRFIGIEREAAYHTIAAARIGRELFPHWI